jgi:hypothetical protein
VYWALLKEVSRIIGKQMFPAESCETNGSRSELESEKEEGQMEGRAQQTQERRRTASGAEPKRTGQRENCK